MRKKFKDKNFIGSPFLLLLLGINFLPTLFAGEIMNVECEYLPLDKPRVTDLLDFLNPDEKTQWYQVWIDTPKIRFYIDTNRNKAASSSGLDFNVGMRGDFIILNRYDFYGEGLTHQYMLNRVDGDFSGMLYAYDNSFLPDFKEGDIMEFYEGQCEQLDLKY